jgi:rhodanese-related sulfurtransferase
MKKIIVCLFSFCLLFGCTKTTNHQYVSPEEMEEIMFMDDIQLVDVRSLEDYTKKHLKGAQRIESDENFEENILQLDKTKPVAVYCNTGRTSKECTEILKKKGFVKIYELKDGLGSWEKSEFFMYDESLQLEELQSPSLEKMEVN